MLRCSHDQQHIAVASSYYYTSAIAISDHEVPKPQPLCSLATAAAAAAAVLPLLPMQLCVVMQFKL
jgi:hypothetical protein